MYSYCFPVMITVLRYLFVVHGMGVKSIGSSAVVAIVSGLSVLLPLFITLSIQAPYL
jgi:hypothetical protein